jgi:hypothetical protein
VADDALAPPGASADEQVVGIRPVGQDLGAADMHAAGDLLRGPLQQRIELAGAERFAGEGEDDAVIVAAAAGLRRRRGRLTVIGWHATGTTRRECAFRQQGRAHGVILSASATACR